MNERKNTLIVIAAIFAAIVLLVFPFLFETNHPGFFQVKQAAITGNMSVRMNPGMYAQSFGSIWDYNKSDGIDLEEVETNPRFSDGSVAKVEGNIRFNLPADESKLLEIHKDFRSYDAFKVQVIENTVREAIANTATLMTAEDSYSTKRSEFTSTAIAQIENGMYETIAKEIDSTDSGGTKFKRRAVEIVKDSTGKPVVKKESPLKKYGVTIVQFVVTNFEYDPTITRLINQKREAEQLKVVATANAEKSKQDAITADEQGKAKVAEANALAQVDKIKAVVEAQKAAEVAEWNKKQAQEEAIAILAKGKAQAESDRLKVAAGLTPLERATLEKETRIGVAAEMSKVKFPDTLIIAGGSKDGSNPFDAIGLNAFYDLTKKVSETNK